MADYRGIVPGTFTMGNVVCGFLAILSSFEGNIVTACWFVILAGFLDGLDGKVARLSGATSQFGMELDSLADFLSFGVAPAVIMHTIKLSTLGKWGWMISIVYIMASAYRLARYNVMANQEEKKDFVGLPVPLAAFLLVSFVIFADHVWGQFEMNELVVSMVIASALLMVSQVQYDMLPDHFVRKQDRIKLAVMVLALIVLMFNPRLLLFPLIASYILFGLLREAYRLFYVGVGKVSDHRYRRRKEDREELDD